MRGEPQTTLLNGLCDGSCRTMEELSKTLALERRAIAKAVCKLVLRGYVERVERGCYRLSPRGLKAVGRGEAVKAGPSGPHTAKAARPLPDTLRQRAWNAMRMSGTFTIGDLAIAASRETDKVPEINIQKWIWALCRAGIVVELPTRTRGTAPTSNGFKRFRLLKDSGPIAPIYRPAHRTVYDHNTEEELPCAGPL